MHAVEAWPQASNCRFGPVFCKSTAGVASRPPRCPLRAAEDSRAAAGAGRIKPAGRERLPLHGLCADFITEAYKVGARDEAIMEHSRHRDTRTIRGYVRRAKLVGESSAALVEF